MTETEMEMYEIEMYRCVREICTGVLHREKLEKELGRLTVLGDGCRITNQSKPALEKGKEEQSDKTSGERDHVSQAHCCFSADPFCCAYRH